MKRKMNRQNRQYRAGIVGVKNIKGKLIKEVLEKMKINFKDFYLYEPGIGEYALFDSFRDEAKLVRRPEKRELEKLDVVFFTLPVEDELFFAPRVSVDLSGSRKDIVKIVSSINDDKIDSYRIANPSPATIGLSYIIHPFSEKIEYGFSTVIEPVSEYGEEAMDELFSQAVNLLNMEEIPKKVLGDVLAFDLFPKGGKKGKGRFTIEEIELMDEIKKTNNINEFYCSILRSGIFHRHSAITFLKLKEDITFKKIEEMLEKSRYIVLDKEKLSPSKFDEEEGFFVHVSDIKKGENGKVWMWSVLDNLKRGSVFNAVEIGLKALKYKDEIVS